MRLLFIIIVVFLFIGGYMIKTSNDLNLQNKEDVSIFSKEYVKWLFHVGKNTVDTTAMVIKEVSNHTWLPNVNETNSTIE